MLDIRLIREHPEIVRKDLKKRGDLEKLRMLDNLIEYDKQWRKLLTEVNEMRHRRKVVTTEIASLKKRREDAGKQMEEAKTIPQEIRKQEKHVREYKEKVDRILLRLPNILHESVPFGKDESENVVAKRVNRF
jgi:seryl-tRNA synthetase